MKKNILTFVFLTAIFSVLVLTFAFADLTVTERSGDLTIFREENVSGYFILNNTGTADITNINFTTSALPSGVTIINFDPATIPTLAPNTPTRVNFTLRASSGADLGEETVTITASNITLSRSFSFDLNVKQNYCENGNRGDKLRIDVSEPDNGDDFYPGETITVSLNVENRDNDAVDFVIETELFDLTDGESIEDASLDDGLDEDEDNDYDLEIKAPYSIDPSHDYVINVKVYEDGSEEDECRQDSISIELKKRTHDIVVDKKSFSSILSCGAPLGLTLKVANAGKEDEEDVKVIVSNTALNLNSQLTKDIDEGDYENYYFNDILPIVAPGNYTLDIKIDYEYDTVYDTVSIQLGPGCVSQRKDVSLSILQQGTAAVGQDAIIKATVTNTGTARTRYTISVSDYTNWGSLVRIEPTSLDLDAGQSSDVFITFRPNENASSINSFKIKAAFDTSSKSQDASLTLASKQTTIPSSFFEQLSFELKRNPGLFILNIVLVIIVIVLIVIAARPRRHVVKEEKTETEPKEARLRRRKK